MNSELTADDVPPEEFELDDEFKPYFSEEPLPDWLIKKIEENRANPQRLIKRSVRERRIDGKVSD